MLCLKLVTRFFRYLAEILQAESLTAEMLNKPNFYKIPKTKFLPIPQRLIIALNHRAQPTVRAWFQRPEPPINALTIIDPKKARGFFDGVKPAQERIIPFYRDVHCESL